MPLVVAHTRRDLLGPQADALTKYRPVPGDSGGFGHKNRICAQIRRAVIGRSPLLDIRRRRRSANDQRGRGASLGAGWPSLAHLRFRELQEQAFGDVLAASGHGKVLESSDGKQGQTGSPASTAEQAPLRQIGSRGD